MRNLDEVIDILEPYCKKDYKVMRQNKTFNPDEFHEFFKDMKKIGKEINEFYIIVDLSRRRALIAILQEKYFNLVSYSEVNINLDEIEKISKVRFEYKNRSKAKFNHPEIIHPKNPFNYYGDDVRSLNEYRISLKLLVSFPKIYIYKNDAIIHLEQLYERIKE